MIKTVSFVLNTIIITRDYYILTNEQLRNLFFLLKTRYGNNKNELQT